MEALRTAGAERWLGRVLGDRFVLLECLGRGGMGAVFEAEDRAVGRRVALKLLEPAARLSRTRARRFLREARAAARIDHPNVVTVYDVGEDRITSALFIVQERLFGMDLRARLAEQPDSRLAVDDALAFLVPIAEALEAAHQLGIVHRDVTPANVFLAEQNGVTIPKLIDFGIAERVEHAARPRAGAPLYGTRQYMSPEHASGDAVDVRADQWAFAAVLYRCLAGRPPDLHDLVPVDFLADVDASLATVVHRALERDRERRFPSMTELVRALTRDRRRTTTASFPRVRPEVHIDPAAVSLSWTPSRRVTARPPPPSPAPVPRTSGIRFGLVLAGRDAAQSQAAQGLATVLRRRVAVETFGGYPQLVDALAEGRVDLAWLPPVAYVRAMRAGAARLLFTVRRDGHRSYSSALVTRADRTISLASLGGLRAAWVDPWSAAGYLVPRRMLRSLGVEPDLAFSAQTFAGSYSEVVRAVLDDVAEVGAVYGRITPSGAVVNGPLLAEPRLRVLAVSAEDIPGDTLCASTTLDVDAARETANACIDALLQTELQPKLRALLGADRFVAANPSRYDALEAALCEDVEVGLAPWP